MCDSRGIGDTKTYQRGHPELCCEDSVLTSRIKSLVFLKKGVQPFHEVGKQCQKRFIEAYIEALQFLVDELGGLQVLHHFTEAAFLRCPA